MKDEDTILLLVAAAVLFFFWKRNQQQAHSTAATIPPPAPSAGLSGSSLAAARASAKPFRAPTATGTPAGVPFGSQAVDRTAPRPVSATTFKNQHTTSRPPTSTSATSAALNNSTLNKAENYSIAGGVAAAKAFGIPPALSRPIAKYGNPIALGRDVVIGGQAVGSAAKTTVKAVGNFFGSIF